MEKPLDELDQITRKSILEANDRSELRVEDHGGRKYFDTTVKEGDEVCDFCGARAIQLCIYECKPFSIVTASALGTTAHQYTEDWTACPDCERVIETNDLEALIDHCFKAMVAKFGPMTQEAEIGAKLHLSILHRNFLEGKK